MCEKVVKELCMSVKELCVKKLRVKRVVCVEELRVNKLCVRKPAYFFPRWVKVGLPSDAVESRAGRLAITKDAN